MRHRIPTFDTRFGWVSGFTFESMSFNDAEVAGKTLVDVIATEDKPVMIRVTPEIQTVFNAGTTNVLTVGTNADVGTDNVIGSGGIAEGATGVGTPVTIVVRERTTVKASYAQTGTAATTGKANFIVEVVELRPA